MHVAYCLLCRPARTGLKAPYDALRFVKHAPDAHGVPEAALKRIQSVTGASGRATWLLPDGRPWLLEEGLGPPIRISTSM